MTQSNALNKKLSNSKPNKLKLRVKNDTKETFISCCW